MDLLRSVAHPNSMFFQRSLQIQSAADNRHAHDTGTGRSLTFTHAVDDEHGAVVISNSHRDGFDVHDTGISASVCTTILSNSYWFLTCSFYRAITIQ